MVMSMPQPKRRYPIGAELIAEDEAHFRVWAPKASKVDVVLEEVADPTAKFYPLIAESDGYFSGAVNAQRRRALSFSSKRRQKLLSRSSVALSTRWAARFLVHCRSNEISMERCAMARIENQRPDHLRNARRHVHERRNMARRCATTVGAGAHRNHRHRNDAGCGVPRQIWLGLRRRRSFRAFTLVWKRPTIYALSLIVLTR